MNSNQRGADEGASHTLDDTLRAAIAGIHENNGLDVLIDPLARFEDVETGIEPLTDAVFMLERAGTEVDLEEVMSELGLVGYAGDEDAVEVSARIEGVLERAQDDGRAHAEMTRGLLLLFDGPAEAAQGVAEWRKWSAVTDDDLTAEGLELDVYNVARHIMRRMLAVDPIVVPAEAAWPAISGFRLAGLPIGRGTYRWAMNGAKAGAEEHRSDLEAAREAEEWRASRIAEAFAGQVPA